jgi:hypothetical protein
VTISNEQSSIQVYPNPVYGKKIIIQLNDIAAGSYALSVYSIGGEILYRQSFQCAGGSISVTISLNNAAAGIYFLEMKNDNNNYHTTVILR